MTARALNVLVNERLVGHLLDADDVWTFEYSEAWRHAADSFDLSPALPRVERVYRDGATSRSVQWYFDNLLPEDALRTVLAKEVELPAGDAFGLLVVQRGSDLYEPLAGTLSTRILKADHPDPGYPASVMNEFFSMRLADPVGLKIPVVQRLYVPQPVCLVERFDRVLIAGADAVGRRHIIDTCQLLNKARAFKYTAANLESMAQVVEYCRSRAATRMRLYRWLVFNLLAGNGDNHLKNISFLVDGEGIELAPH